MERRSKHRQPCTVNPLVSLSLLSFLVLLRHALPPEPTSGLPPSPAAIVSNTTVAAPQAHALRSASTPTPPWPKPLVIVPAVWKEWDRGLPHWAREDASPLWSVFAYQRRDPSKPRFAPNFGYEGAIYLRFIVDHYDALPDYSVFIQADMPDGGDWLYWISCLNSSTQFMALPNEFVLGRDMTSWRTADDLFIEACWREILEAFGFVVPPRDPIQVAFTSRASFLASRAQLLRHPKAHYEKALKLIGSARCHEGPLDFDKLFLFEKRCKDLVGPDADVKSPACDPIRREWQARALDPARVEADLNKLPGAMAFEHLIHIVIGGEPFKTVPEQPCEKLLHRSLCAWSPCV